MMYLEFLRCPCFISPLLGDTFSDLNEGRIGKTWHYIFRGRK
jgi:hypothetical protein